MPNTFITLLDGKETLTEDNVLTALAGVPFVQHQYKWLVDRLTRETPDLGRSTLTGYVGIKRVTDKREIRFAEMLRLIQMVIPSRRDALPERINPQAPAIT